MNVSFDEHISEDALEAYSMGKLSEEESAPVEEHLLLCPTCQAGLDANDEYIQAIKAAASDCRKARICSFIPTKSIVLPKISPSAWAALFALVILVVDIRFNGTPRLESELTLQSARGGPTLPRAQAGRSLLLRMDTTEIQQPGSYQLEIVDASGQPIWHAFVMPRNDRIVTLVPKRPRAGRYWVRLYDTGGPATLLREYGLDIE